MKRIALTGWTVFQRDGRGALARREIEQFSAADGGYSTFLPRGVHEVLLAHGAIEDPRADGDCAKCAWVAESDWVYAHRFEEDLPAAHARLLCKGLDTFCDLYLNDERIGSCDNMFLPAAIELTGGVPAGGTLLIHFHSPARVLAETVAPDKWPGVHPFNLLRKCKHDYTCFGGQNPFLTLVGPFDDILVECREEGAIERVRVEALPDGARGRITASVEAVGHADGIRIEVYRKDALLSQAEFHALSGEVELACAERWYPRGYGAQPLYRVRIALMRNGREVDSAERTLGFRECLVDANLNVRVNGRRVRMWGANLTPMDGMSHAWDQRRFERMLELAENANMNLIRVWGGGYPYPDSLYEACARRGFLVWQDFTHDYGMYPDDERFTRIFLSEAEHMVTRLRHFPCILLWCGGNETFLGADYIHPELPYLGAHLFTRDYKELCARLDPRRFYHVNSPSGGAYPNDPGAGDTHCYSHEWYVPGVDMPAFMSENNRMCTPCLDTLEQMMGDRIWPEGFGGRWTNKKRELLPESWRRWMVPVAEREAGELQDFYDADSPETLFYRFGASVRDHIRESVEGIRRGKRKDQAQGEFFSNGHMWWKLNDTWPSIYCGAIDYFLRPNMAYYALKAAYQPVLISFERRERIFLWLVNDSDRPLSGSVRVRVYDMERNCDVNALEMSANVPADSSSLLGNLDALGQIRRRRLLIAELRSDEGRVLAVKTELLDIERRLDFPKADVRVKPHRRGWLVESDGYARCVTLRGKDANGQPLAFSDNYFEVIPGYPVYVEPLGEPAGEIAAEDIYA